MKKEEETVIEKVADETAEAIVETEPVVEETSEE